MNLISNYAELHALSNYSFLRGASTPAELVERAHAQGYAALALTDECSLAGVVRAHVAAKALNLHVATGQPPEGTPTALGRPGVDRGLKLIIGSEFLVQGEAGEPLFKLLVLARHLAGYGNLCQFITDLRRAADKGTYCLRWSQLQLAALEGCLFIALLPRAASDAELLAPARWLLQHVPGRAWLGVELLRELGDEMWLQRLRALSELTALPLVATGDVHMHRRSRKPLQDVMTATRLNKPIAACGFELQPNAERHLRSRLRLAQLYPAELLAETLVVAGLCDFSLDEIRYQYPSEVIPAGSTPTAHLRALTETGAARRWPSSATNPGLTPKLRAQIEHELDLIKSLGYEHYFLTVADIVRFARGRKILCQGRGSAANSIVCYCLFITEVDPARSSMLFERFISRERNEPPDIDVDFEHERREEVIQYLYRKYGRERAALTAVVISYRPRSAIRDVGRALDMDEALVEKLAKDHSGWSEESLPDERLQQLQIELGLDPQDIKLRQLVRLSRQLMGMPRHLSQHPGGFVLTQGPLSRLVPIENASMAERTVIQWDKDDIDALGLMKVDVLALGMLSALRRSFELISTLRGKPFGMADVPEGDTPTYDMICQADTIGVFQIESRAQMSMLPRLQPRCFYDLVIEVALVRPGPIAGGMVHPYLKNRALPPEQIKYPKDELRAALERTCGIPIFQEQVMQVAMIAAGFSPGEADQLRRAMAAWKRPGDLARFHEKILTGMRERGYQDEFAEAIFRQIKGFASYGFPESHAASFALLTYMSCWVKRHEPAAFLCALLNSQPLGFYTPSQLVQDARRHQIEVRAVDVNESERLSSLETLAGRQQPAVRLGLHLISGLSKAAAERIEASRRDAGPFSDAQDLALRAELDQQDMQQLAAADALMSLAGQRRQQVWQASALSAQPRLLQGSFSADDELAMPTAPEGEEVIWDYAALGLTLRSHPLKLLRPRLAKLGLKSSEQLQHWPTGRKAHACGIVTVRQRPQTAHGTLFISLEDESGSVQVIVWPAVYAEHRIVVRAARLLAVHGVWQHENGVRNLIARSFDDLTPLLGRLGLEQSRDFR
ncbi:error-prone DNA polymerase [Paucibacter sp. B2R-40]|uniref:error-prone DNA polymerase n=1 Tax=Paucibacter sp. B2R-40 TaxID=2893554 RepID=UPI0021E43D28|nr:error-prone DNA polymerase [Paucibacter sp. B2R-40]MCV2356683.1 error-prone DNA polymerase [Paucibacter sp. B2R-40]